MGLNNINPGCNPGNRNNVQPTPVGVEYLILYISFNSEINLIFGLLFHPFYNPNQPIMRTYTQILYQIVYSTKYRKKTLKSDIRASLFKYLYGILKNKNCFVYQINGVEDHIHFLISLHPSISLASLVKDLKLGASSFISRTDLFENFGGWQDGYSAFTYSIKEKERLVNYIKNQEKHHQKKSFREELIDLLYEHGIEFDEKYLD
jgi:putative transposase